MSKFQRVLHAQKFIANEDGRISLLFAVLLVIVAGAVLTFSAISSVQLHKIYLQGVGDQAAYAAVSSFANDSYYRQRGVLTSEEAQVACERFLTLHQSKQAPIGDPIKLEEVRVEGNKVFVSLSWLAPVPFMSKLLPVLIPIRADSVARRR
ncbi:hypothetical protein BK816_02635 [Boudabousia tangfeifanii]|uniref:Uncharacterized protein n=1 Tax=Boudabousia tangfeifanii TaxID=1912795 RepID=A0A1D9MJ12_9ACTO|nr:hypothetical protein [Boudabousia tangfeifanii]AOZ72331.1 hypothetical protein BK816_02635 [Boudabousia tangfeifanii]